MNINIFCRPEEAMLNNWQKLVSKQKYFLFLEKFELSSTKIMLPNRKRNIPLYDFSVLTWTFHSFLCKLFL